jgi:hypothetical protein
LPDRSHPEELDRSLGEAVKAVNGKRRHRLLPWPAADNLEYRRLREQDGEGWRQWEGHWETARPEASKVVWSAWWTDTLERKQHRIVGHRTISMDLGYYPLFSPATSGQPPLALVHPQGAVVRTMGGQRDVLVRCSCGLIGLPRSLGWMRTCCGPCHDRREEGQAPPESEDRAGMVLAWSADRRTAALRNDNIVQREKAVRFAEVLPSAPGPGSQLSDGDYRITLRRAEDEFGETPQR